VNGTFLQAASILESQVNIMMYMDKQIKDSPVFLVCTALIYCYIRNHEQKSETQKTKKEKKRRIRCRV